LLKDDDLLARIEADWRSAGLSPRRTAMLEYVEKLTVRPQDVSRADVETMRTAGFTDRDIHDICEVAAYYAYVNRIADGLGVAQETWIPEDP
jgi:uncharacterized peroxidase-related enzyme